MGTQVLIKKPGIHTREKTTSLTNGAGVTGQLSVEECKQIHTCQPVQNSKTLAIIEASVPGSYKAKDERVQMQQLAQLLTSNEHTHY